MDPPSVFLSKAASCRNLSDTFTQMGLPPGISPQHTLCTSALPLALVFFSPHFTDCHLAREWRHLPSTAQGHALGQGFLPVLRLLPGMRISRFTVGQCPVIRTPGFFLPPTQPSATGLCWHLLINSHWPDFCPPISGTSVPQEHRLPRCQSLCSVS